jgi:hypothetical protein
LHRPAARSAGRRRLPLEQAAAGDGQADERDPDRVEPLARLAGRERELQSEPREGHAQVVGDRAQEGGPRLVGRRTFESLGGQQERRKRERRQREPGPCERMARQDDPPHDEQEQRRRRQQAAAEVVEDLPARHDRQAIARDAGSRGHERKSHHRICQSPRTQRCWRRACASTLEG